MSNFEKLVEELIAAYDEWVNGDVNFGCGKVDDAVEMLRKAIAMPGERSVKPYYQIELAKQRVAIVERIMKLPYIKATRNSEHGQERFVCRDDVVTVIHDYAKVSAAGNLSGRMPTAQELGAEPTLWYCSRCKGTFPNDDRVHDCISASAERGNLIDPFVACTCNWDQGHESNCAVVKAHQERAEGKK